jgi:hypothetical protein
VHLSPLDGVTPPQTQSPCRAQARAFCAASSCRCRTCRCRSAHAHGEDTSGRKRSCKRLLCGAHSRDIYSNVGGVQGPRACTQCLCTCASALRRTGVCFACDLAQVCTVVCVCLCVRMQGRRGSGPCDVAWHGRWGRCGTSAEEQAYQYQDRFFSKSLMGKAWWATSSSCLKEQRAMSMEHRSRRWSRGGTHARRQRCICPPASQARRRLGALLRPPRITPLPRSCTSTDDRCEFCTRFPVTNQKRLES